MYNYAEIQELFGTPLNLVTKPQMPFKLKTWHVIGGAIVLGLVAYGAYSLHRDFLTPERHKFRFKEE